MNKRHKHADVIIAWANGETVQQFNGEDGDTTYWVEWNNTCGITPDFGHCKWRIKPKIVKKQADVAVYKLKDGSYKVQLLFFGDMHFTIEGSTMVTRQPIEWEEEV